MLFRSDGVHSKEDKGYWGSNIEMFARAFACYIQDKLSPNRSDYLCGHAESCFTIVGNDGRIRSGILKAYPEGEERKAINKCFDKLIEIAKDKELFAEYNQEDVVFNFHQNRDNIDYEFTSENVEQMSFIDFGSIDNEIDIAENY